MSRRRRSKKRRVALAPRGAVCHAPCAVCRVPCARNVGGWRRRGLACLKYESCWAILASRASRWLIANSSSAIRSSFAISFAALALLLDCGFGRRWTARLAITDAKGADHVVRVPQLQYRATFQAHLRIAYDRLKIGALLGPI